MENYNNLTMKKTSATIVFFGNERLATGVTTAAPTLQALIENHYRVAAVVSNFAENQPRNARELEVKKIAEQHDIPVWLPKSPLSIATHLEKLKPDIGVLVAYGKIVPEKIINIFPHGIINIHPSLLPLHRGPTPIESAMLQGESATGVSLMQLAKAMDAGPVFAQKKVVLTGNETKALLTAKLLNIGKDMLLEHLPAILDGSLSPKPQDDSRATYDERITKEDGVIDWNKPAAVLEREIRAYLEWPKSRTELAGKEVTITEAHVITEHNRKPGDVHVDKNLLVVSCGQGSLVIDHLKPAGKPEMSAQAFLAGYGQRLKR
jgi:methionyl-tRNA formyltransferase